MKRFIPTFRIALLAASFLGTVIGSAAAQELISTVTSQLHDSSFSAGRDYWIECQSNYWGIDLGGKYIRIYITSPRTTTAFVESEGTATSVPISAYKVASFKVPTFWEMESSGIVESQAIHVYSKDAPLEVYNLSHNPYTSDGEYIIPTIGWGTDYVVAAYNSLYEGAGVYVYDLPSTCAVVSDQDSTQVQITPSCDCRQSANGSLGGNGNSTVVVYTAGKTYSWTLNRGQCMELMPVKATDTDHYDLTGTVIHANHPIGVFGGSGCTNIPESFSYCDHIEDMTPPVRTWGQTYYTTGFYDSANIPGYARYLFIASQNNQTIYRRDCQTGNHAECIIADRYGVYWDDMTGAQKFWSNAPFLCVQYINGSGYPGDVPRRGDPAEANVVPRERFEKTVVFQTPYSVGNIIPYTNLANITVNVNDTAKTFLDGKKITRYLAQCVDTDWLIFTDTSLAQGSHIITGDDSGVGVQVYGYGYDESYAWASESFQGTLYSPDSAAPVATITSINCYLGKVLFTDTGINASQIAAMWLDSDYNMNYLPSLNHGDGIATDTESFNFYPVDLTKPSYLRVTAYDFAGNSTTVTLSYASFALAASEPALNLSTTIGTTKTVYDTLTYTGSDTSAIDTLYLANGKSDFEIDSAVTTPFLPNSKRILKLSFTPDSSKQLKIDTVKIVTKCDVYTIALSGFGIQADWSINEVDWKNIPFPDTPVWMPVTVTNNLVTTLHVTGASTDTSEFVVDQSAFPLAIASGSTGQFNVSYTPMSANEYAEGELTVQSAEASFRDAPLFAHSVPAASIAPNGIALPNEQVTSGLGTITVTIPTDWRTTHFELLNILGQTVYSATILGTEAVNTNNLPRGIYFWRLTSEPVNQTGKIILGN